MEHVFGRYVECPYNTKTLFFNREYAPITIKNKINPNTQTLWIDAIPGFENYLYYDPICGKDKVITIGNKFSDGSLVEESSYTPCRELVYYWYDIQENGERELDFKKIGLLTFTIIGRKWINDSGLGVIPNPESVDKFIGCFTNFTKKDCLKNCCSIFHGFTKKMKETK